MGIPRASYDGLSMENKTQEKVNVERSKCDLSRRNSSSSLSFQNRVVIAALKVGLLKGGTTQ